LAVRGSKGREVGGMQGRGRSRKKAASPAISIVMPAYNEEANIEKTVRACSEALDAIGMPGEIVVTNDGSRDRTLDILTSLEKEVPGLVVVNHEKNRGYGAALRSAVEAASGEYIVTIDSDGQFDIGELPGFIENRRNGTAVVTGYRKKKKDSMFRVVANRGLNGFITLLFGVRFTDINCAFRLYSADVLKGINIESAGYQAPSEIMIKLVNKGYKTEEIGVNHYAREGGVSALRPMKAIGQMTAFLIYLKLKTVLYKKGMITSL